MKQALITGASSGIGEATAERLTAAGWEVYGIGRDFTKTAPELLAHPLFHAVELDLLDTKKLKDFAVSLHRQGVMIDVLVNNAGCAFYGVHEMLDEEKIRCMVRTDLEVPMILSSWYLREFKKRRAGTIINIASVTARELANPHGAAYGACKAGLLSFSESIFAEARKYGVKVSCIMPDMTDTRLYRHADFGADPAEGAALSAEDVADAVLWVLSAPQSLVVPELVLTPQYHRVAGKTKRPDFGKEQR